MFVLAVEGDAPRALVASRSRTGTSRRSSPTRARSPQAAADRRRARGRAGRRVGVADRRARRAARPLAGACVKPLRTARNCSPRRGHHAVHAALDAHASRAAESCRRRAPRVQAAPRRHALQMTLAVLASHRRGSSMARTDPDGARTPHGARRATRSHSRPRRRRSHRRRRRTSTRHSRRLRRRRHHVGGAQAAARASADSHGRSIDAARSARRTRLVDLSDGAYWSLPLTATARARRARSTSPTRCCSTSTRSTAGSSTSTARP